MKTSQVLSVIAILWSIVIQPSSSSAQIYSLNIVGYVNLPILAGNNLIGNPLYRATNDSSLNVLFSTAPSGSMVSVWDGATGQFLPASVYQEGSGWTIDYNLPPTLGFWFNSPSDFTNTFVGEVPTGGSIPPEGLLLQPPSLGDGVFLVSSSLPFSGATFEQVIGRSPAEGESVRRLNALTQNYYTTTFRSGSWDNGVPGLQVGESAFYTLGTAASAVPEPSTLVFISLAASCTAIRLRRRF